MAIPWHKYASRYKVVHLTDATRTEVFAANERVKVHTAFACWGEETKVAPTSTKITFYDSDDVVLIKGTVNSLETFMAVTTPGNVDNGLQIQGNEAGTNIYYFVSYTPEGT